MALAGSYSRLNGHKTCPKKLFLVNLSKQVKEPPSAILDRGSQVHATLAHAAADAHASMPSEFPIAVKQIERLRAEGFEIYAEREFAIDANRRPVEWFGANVYYRFKLDIVAKHPTRLLAEILDWKTGKVRVDQDQMRDYAIAAFLMFPDIETVATRLVFLDAGQVVDSLYPRSAFTPLWDALETRMQALQAAATAGDWPATPNPTCRWCPVTQAHCEHSPLPAAPAVPPAAP